MKIHETFDRDPREAYLANDGQARVADAIDERAITQLRAELETFVCEGQFKDAIERILENYLLSLNKPRQTSAWVSGFFGSGKSHLLKMLQHLWVNTEFQDGATARTLVGSRIPDEIEAHLVELDTHARRIGRSTVAAAGTLLGGSVDHVRRTVLSILLRSLGWPSQYQQAMFCFWLREQGTLDAVRAGVEASGKDWLKELNNLYVSPVIANAIIQADPNFAENEQAVRQALIHQFPQSATDITTEQFVEAARKTLSENRELPLTIIVLDEVQQYINEVGDRAAIITEVAEALQTQFDSRVMLVAAGQSALSAGTQALMWLRDRFRITVELSDADVEAVTRRVILKKKPSAEPPIDSMFDSHSGEVDRHLRGTRLGSRPEDRRTRVADYPLLPTRRRFWEACFQAADRAGTHSQLRSQLRIVHDSLRDIAEKELGAVIPSSDLFNALAPSLVNTGVLLNEVNTRIQKLDDGSAEGRLRRDLCGLVFLIGKLPREAGADLGVRANPATLADLLVPDIKADSGPFRKRVDEALEALVAEGVLMKVGDECRIQTTEGAEWDRAFRERQTAIRQKEVEISSRRERTFAEAVQQIVSQIKVTHGEAKIRRTVAMHFGNEAPPSAGDQVVVWVRDGWSCALREVEGEARRLGQQDPILHIHLPQKGAAELKAAIIEVEACQQVLDHYGLPASDEGREARQGMESRKREAEARRDEIVQDIVRSSRVFQGGGAEIFGEELSVKIQTGAEASLARLFSDFQDGDHRAWEVAVKRAREGSDHPFKVVGWDRPVEEHPVARAVLEKVGSGARGSEIQKDLKAAPYGWPQDAVDAALIALHRSGHLRAVRNREPVDVGGLDQAGVKAAEFRPEKVRLSTSDRITLRGLFNKAGVACKSGEEEARAVLFLEELRKLASRSGGDAPFPPLPDSRLLDELGSLTGTEQLGAILERREEIETKIDEWTRLANRAEQRGSVWEKVIAFRDYTKGLPVLQEVSPEIDAMIEQRSLLSDADHLSTLAAKLSGSLRKALNDRHRRFDQEINKAHEQLDSDSTWAQLAEDARGQIQQDLGLLPPAVLEIGSDDQLRGSLARRSISAWDAEIDAVPSRVARALEEAARRVQQNDPKIVTTTVSLRRGTLTTRSDVEEWVEEHQKKLTEAVAKGPVLLQ